MARDYKAEYERYHSTEKQKLDRAARNASLAKKTKANGGKKPKGHVHHKDNNPRNTSLSNLSIVPAKRNLGKTV